MFRTEEFAGRRGESEALGIAVAVAPDGGNGGGVADEGIVGRHASVVVQAVDLAAGQSKVLGVLMLAAFADAEEDITFAVEGDAGTEVPVGFDIVFKLGLENCLLLDERPVLQLAADDARESGRGAVGFGQLFAVGKINPAVGRVVRMRDDIHEAGLAADVDHGQAADRPGGELAVFDQIKKSALLRHDRLRRRKKREGPRLDDRIDPRIEFEVVELALRRHRSGGRDNLGLIAQHLGASFAEIDDHGADLLFRNRGSPSGHALLGKPGANAFREAFVVAAIKPSVLEQ